LAMAPASKRAGPAPGLAATHGEELAWTTLVTREEVEGHFASLCHRHQEFRKHRLAIVERQLQARRQGGGGSGGRHGTTVGHQRSSSNSSSGDSSTHLRRTLSSPGLLGGISRPPAPEPPLPAAKSSAGFTCSRFGAAVPASQHPAPHPGALAERPHARNEVSNVACPAAEQPTAGSSAAWPSTVQSAASSGSPTRRNSIRLVEQHDSNATQNPEQQASAIFDAEELFEAEEEALGRLLARRQGTLKRASTDTPEAIQNMSNFMSLLGPRYKVLPRHVLWERANRDESEHKKPPRRHNTNDSKRNTTPLQAARRNTLASLDDIDPDGGARAAWLAARAHENERRSRQPQSPSAVGSSPAAGRRSGTDLLGFMMMNPP